MMGRWGSSRAVAILENGFEIPFRCLRKVRAQSQVLSPRKESRVRSEPAVWRNP